MINSELLARTMGAYGVRVGAAGPATSFVLDYSDDAEGDVLARREDAAAFAAALTSFSPSGVTQPIRGQGFWVVLSGLNLDQDVANRLGIAAGLYAQAVDAATLRISEALGG